MKTDSKHNYNQPNYGLYISVVLSGFSIGFSIMYLLCGITDMVDGTIARKTKSISELRSRLDTVADGIFVAVCFLKYSYIPF